MVGESAHDEALKAVIDETKDKPNYYSVAETLVAFYFPDLERQLQSLDEVSTEMTVIVIKYSSSVQAAGRDLNRSEAVEFYEPFRAKLHAFAKGGFDLKQAIVAHGRELKLLPKRKFAGWLRFPWSRG